MSESADSPPWSIRRPSLENNNEALRAAMLELNDIRGFGSVQATRGYPREYYGDDELGSVNTEANAKQINARAHHWSWGFICLVFSALLGGLGNSLEPVSALAWLSIVLLLYGFEHVVFYFDGTPRFLLKFMGIALFIIITQGLGACLGFSSVFGYPDSTSYTVFLSFCYGCAIWTCCILLCLCPHFAFERRYPRNWLTVLVFPSTYTVVNHLLIGRTVSSMISIGNAVLDFAPLRQVAALIGLPGITFTMAYTATLAALLIGRHDVLKTRKLVKYTFVGLMITFTVTGFLIYADSFYQRNVQEEVVPVVPVSCIVAQNAPRNSTQWRSLWSNINARVTAGDYVILTAEEAFSISSDDEEEELLAMAKRAVSGSMSSTGHGTFLGVSYMKQSLRHDDAKITNHFALIAPDGSVAWNYLKAHPVPGVEDNVEAGPAVLPIYDTKGSLGRISGAICFDMDYPEYILQAGQQKVDLLLQPSWTWNAISSRHFETNSVRAIENGFTLFRCSSNGESGIVGPRGKVHQRQFTGNNPNEGHYFSLPLNRRVGTLFARGGYGFEWMCLAIASLLYAFILLPEAIMRRIFPSEESTPR